MTWNYRVIKRKDVDGNYIYGIHEVYYEENAIDYWTVDSIKLEANSYEDLNNIKGLYMLAFDAPVLNEEELQKEIIDE